MKTGKAIFRRFIFPFILKTNLESLFSRFSPHHYLVLAYHGVARETDFEINGRAMDVKQFEQHLRYFKTNFEVIPLQEIFQRSQEKIRPTRRTLAITFDDGYENNYLNAFPLLQKYELPATLFVVSSSLSNDNYGIWPDLFDIVHKYSPLQNFEVDGHVFVKRNNTLYCDDIRLSIGEYFNWLGKEREEKLKDLILRYKIKELKQQTSPEYWRIMNEHQLQEVSKSKFIEIGSHTHLHYNLANVSHQLVREELQQSKVMLENSIQKEVRSIAFPNGSYNEEVKRIARECGYQYLLAVDSRDQSDREDETIRSRLCISNTTTFESNIIQVHSAFNKVGF